MNTTSIPKIAVFTKQLDNWQSGSGHHLDQIMQRVVAINAKEKLFHITFIHYKPSSNPIYKNVRELIVPRNPLLSSFILKKEAFDLVHYTPLTIYAPIYGVPNKKVATIHGVEQLLIPHFFGPVEMFHERYLVPRFARKMDGIFTVSNTTKKYLVDHFKVPDENIVVAYNGISNAYYPRNKKNNGIFEQYKIKTPYIYHISRFSERKNPWVLLKAFKRFILQHNGRPHKLVCAGKGWDSDAVQKEAKILQIEDKLITPGFISENDSAELMSGADLFVFPSLAEGFGIPNIEAMATGCPVVTSGAFAIPEVVDDCALLVTDPSDIEGFAEAMGKIVDDERLRNNLITKGLERVRSGLFSWDKAARALLNLYTKVLEI
jgi:glycosyltransferase involved in cell wall biosynthesis